MAFIVSDPSCNHGCPRCPIPPCEPLPTVCHPVLYVSGSSLRAQIHSIIFENMKHKSSTPTATEADVCALECFHPRTVTRVQAALAGEAEQLASSAELFKMLGNTRRLMILRALREAELCVCDLAHLLGLSVAATSQQLRILRSQGWVQMRSAGKMVYYRWNEEAPLPALNAAVRGMCVETADEPD